ncbi:MAG TPA: RodZ domain-containing protein [Bryobacteraceae bacterium]|nr:RodZ domain-containing protein [Bryobacteraceae bacterium]
MLRSAREGQRREIAEISESLCIAQRYLCAIEEDDLQSLPGTFFYKSFVKQYAAALGVSEGEIRAGVESVTQSAPEPLLPGQTSPGRRRAGPLRPLDPVVETVNREYVTDRRMGGAVAALGAVILACSSFYTWWSRPPKPKAAEQAATAGVQQPAAAAATIPVASTPEASKDELGGLELSLSATERTWLSITSEGKQVFSGILEPGETKTLSGLEAARMKVGNAGGLEIRWNGKPVGPIGPSGQVRTLVFTADNLQIVEPEPAAAPDASL